MEDFVPRSLANLQTWLTGLKAGMTTDGPTLGRAAADVTADTAFIDSLLTPVSDALTKETAAMEASGAARMNLRLQNKKLRDLLGLYKKSPGWNSGMAASWQVESHSSQVDMDTQKPTLTLHIVGGQVVIRGKKLGFTSVSIDMRLAGTANWTTIGVKLSHFPFIDNTAPQTPGKPESREYRGRGYVGDTEMGQPSDIVTEIYPG